MQKLLCCLSVVVFLSGCAGFQQAMQQQQIRQNQDRDRKARALMTGTPESTVLAAWGSPDNSFVTQSASGTVEQLQYGKCAAKRNWKSGVVFITLIDGKVSRYSMTRC